MKKPLVVAIAALVLVTLLGTALLLGGRRRGGVARKPDGRPPVTLAVSTVPPEPSVWIDVHQPGKAWKALRGNAWLAKALAAPLGQGMTTGWAGFLATRGQDVADAFPGVLLDVVSGKLLADPFRLVFFSGPAATGAPAIVVPRPSGAAESAYELVEGLARNGSLGATHCPGAKPPDPPAEGQPAPAPALVISRWLVAEHAVFAARRDGRIVLARNPVAVLQALCALPADVPASSGVDVSVSFSRDALGRETQLAASLLGLGAAPRLAFAIEGDRLEPKGILGDLGDPGRLDRAAPSDPLLRLVPADAGVVFLATLRLPEKLSTETLAAHLDRSYRGAHAARTVALVWNPRGSGRLATEVAVLWPERDAALLREAFAGPNRMDRRRACGHEVYASTGPLAQALLRACEGKSPSLLDAPPVVAAGLRAPSSFSIGANLGVLLSRLLADGWAEDPQNRAKDSTDIDAARRALEELPFMGLRGVAEGSALVPGGFRS